MEDEANILDERARRIVIDELREVRAEAKEPEQNARLLLAIMYLEGRWPAPPSKQTGELA